MQILLVAFSLLICCSLVCKANLKDFSPSFDIVSPDEEDRETFYDYLITNVKLYFDRFEQELSPSVEEPTTPEYEETANEESEEMDDFNLEEYIDLDGLLEGIHR